MFLVLEFIYAKCIGFDIRFSKSTFRARVRFYILDFLSGLFAGGFGFGLPLAKIWWWVEENFYYRNNLYNRLAFAFIFYFSSHSIKCLI